MAFYFLGPIDVPDYPPPRTVRIYVPARAPAVDRPALLLFDGQNVFDDGPSSDGGWHAHESVERLARNVAPPVIVGIDHGHDRRITELLPFEFGPHVAGADGFLDWTSSWLVPLLQRDFAVTRDARKIVIGGSSLGGIAAFYAQLTMPERFGGCIAMSPSFWVARGRIFRWVERREIPTDKRFYLDAGRREVRMMFDNAQRMDALLSRKGAERRLFVDDSKGHHTGVSWGKRLLRALRFHFGTSRAAAL
ncbi:MAG: alpha/beta hydrolase-fold protein [Polyangiaceae bacterium]